MEDIFRQIAQEEARKIFAEMQTPQSVAPDQIPVKQAEKEYNLSASTLYRHVDTGHLGLYKLGGKSFVKRSELERLFSKVR